MALDEYQFVKQLRVGNYIYPYGNAEPNGAKEVCLISLDIDDEYWPCVEVVNIGKHNNCTGDILRNFVPIEISEWWLERLGFRASKQNNSDLRYMFESFIFDSGVMYFQFENYQVNIPNIKIEYVHQLQNLWFSLTGHELTIS